jgi:hypothetical protein
LSLDAVPSVIAELGAKEDFDTPASTIPPSKSKTECLIRRWAQA